jgi:hypothetical protein
LVLSSKSGALSPTFSAIIVNGLLAVLVSRLVWIGPLGGRPARFIRAAPPSVKLH